MARAKIAIFWGMLTTFCLRLACGMIGSLLLLAHGEVNPRFYRTHYLVAMGLIAAAMIAGPVNLAGGFQETLAQMTSFDVTVLLNSGRIILFLGLFLCSLGSISWSIEGHPGSRMIALASVASLVIPLGFRAAGAVKQFQLLDF